MADAQTLLEQIQSLPPDRVAEIKDFVAFIAGREQERTLARAMNLASAPTFAKVWENLEDDCYDAI